MQHPENTEANMDAVWGAISEGGRSRARKENDCFRVLDSVLRMACCNNLQAQRTPTKATKVRQRDETDPQSCLPSRPMCESDGAIVTVVFVVCGVGA